MVTFGLRRTPRRLISTSFRSDGSIQDIFFAGRVGAMECTGNCTNIKWINLLEYARANSLMRELDM